MANYKVEQIEGIGEKLGAKFRKVGIINTDKLLAGTKTKKQREALEAATGIPHDLMLRFANMADLFRIYGIGRKFSDLLEAAGVDTVVELAARNPEHLAAKMEEVNAVKKLANRVPALKEVERWVAEAKTMPRVLEY